MYNTILVPLDGSGRAEAILPHVEDLAHRFQAKVIFMQIVEPVVIVGGPHEFYGQMYKEQMEQNTEAAKSYLTRWQGEFREKGIEAKIRVENGSVVETIISVAKDESADLIAMASHGRSGLANVFYGSVAAGVLHRIDRPLLLVRS
jgi:nucleotide-binding universal stress UspA family protein